MRETELTECHQRLVESAKAFDTICRQRRIPYYMLGGTLLGAIRHQGFIPWDDDMDFGVPRAYYETLREALEKELPPHMKCQTYSNSETILYGFMKIHQQTGGDIDIFPLDRCHRKDKRIPLIYGLIRLQTFIFVESTENTGYKSLIKKLLRRIVPFNQRFLLKRIDKRIAQLPQGAYLANFYGRWKEKEIIPLAHYGSNQEYAFEDTRFLGLQNYDAYLSALYGDYREIPPEGKRLTHAAPTGKRHRKQP